MILYAILDHGNDDNDDDDNKNEQIQTQYRIPNMKLPENASESYSTSASTSIPYGSQNESQFRSYMNKSKVRFTDNNIHNDHNNYNSSSNSNNNINDTSEQKISQSYQQQHRYLSSRSPSQSQLQLQSHSQPYQNSYNLQLRVEEMRRNGALIKNETKSGLAALLGDEKSKENGNSNMNTKTNPTLNGIVALLDTAAAAQEGRDVNNIFRNNRIDDNALGTGTGAAVNASVDANTEYRCKNIYSRRRTNTLEHRIQLNRYQFIDAHVTQPKSMHVISG